MFEEEDTMAIKFKFEILISNKDEEIKKELRAEDFKEKERRVTEEARVNKKVFRRSMIIGVITILGYLLKILLDHPGIIHFIADILLKFFNTT